MIKTYIALVNPFAMSGKISTGQEKVGKIDGSVSRYELQLDLVLTHLISTHIINAC